eukprot:gene30924-35979_t
MSDPEAAKAALTRQLAELSAKSSVNADMERAHRAFLEKQAREMKVFVETQEAKEEERKYILKPALQMDVLFLLDATVSMKGNRDALVKYIEGTVD